MNLLAPWLLGGLAALAVPVLVHLIRRRDPRRTPFPSLMFMEGSPHEARGQRSLRDPWLLLLRLCALAAAVLAFAGPILDTGSDSIVEERSGDLVVALDRSMSMGYADRWERAVDKIEARLDAVDPGTRVALVLFDVSAERAAPLEQDATVVRSRLAEAEPRAMGTDIRAGVAAAGALLADSDATSRTLMLVSDFQRGAWRADGASLLPSGTQVEVVGVADDDVVNAAVTDVRISTVAIEEAGPSARDGGSGQTSENEGTSSDESATEPVQARPELEVTATVARHRGVRQGEGGPNWAALVVGGREIERVALSAASDLTEVRFERLPAPRLPTAAAVRIQGDAFDADDIRHLVLAPEPSLTVLVIEDVRREAGAANLYLRRALALAQSPPIRMRNPASDALAPADLVGADAVIVNNARLDESAHDLLGQYVREAGGGVLLIAGGRTGGAWPGGSGGYLPGQLGGRVEADRASPLTIVDRGGLAASQGLLDGFSLVGGNLGQVWRYRRLTTGSGDNVLLRYSDRTPALIERRAGLGRAMVLTSALDNRWNSIPVAPLFVPFVHRLIAELSSHEAPLRAFSTASAIDIERWLETQPEAGPLRQALSAGDRLALKAPRGSRDTLRETDRIIQLVQPGVYELDRADGTGPELMWAANPPAQESELDAIDPGVVLNALVRMAAVQPPAAGRERVSGTDAEGLALWRFALALALALLVLETWLSNRGALVRSQPTVVR